MAERTKTGAQVKKLIESQNETSLVTSIFRALNFLNGKTLGVEVQGKNREGWACISKERESCTATGYYITELFFPECFMISWLG